MTKHSFRIEQVAPDLPETWALTEILYWPPSANRVLQGDVNEERFAAAYDALDWDAYYERLKGTPFYDSAIKWGGLLSFGARGPRLGDDVYSRIGDMSTVEGDWLEAHPEFNQVLHDLHVEAAEQMLDFLLKLAQPRRRKRRRKQPRRR